MRTPHDLHLTGYNSTTAQDEWYLLTVIPEPASPALLGIGLAALAAQKRRTH